MRIKFLLCACFLCQLVFVARAVFGQSDFAIVRGRLTQISGSPLVRAEVIATSLSNRTRYSALTDGSGNYMIYHLPGDRYKVRFEAAGFKPYSEELVSVFAGMSTQIDVRLADVDSDQVSGGASTEPNILKIDRTDVSTTITRHEIESLPILNQNLSRLELLVPGALSSPDVLPPPQNPQASAFISVNGQRFSGNGLTLDGIADRDPLEGLGVILPSFESVAGMKVTTQNYSAQFGEASAGFVTVQTRSASDAWHGSVYGYPESGFGQASQPLQPRPHFRLAVRDAAISVAALVARFSRTACSYSGIIVASETAATARSCLRSQRRRSMIPALERTRPGSAISPNTRLL